MATIRVRYLVCRPAAAGALPRWFWQPSSALRAQGWRPRRVPLDWSRHTDAGELQRAAMAAAEALNAELDATHLAAARAAAAPEVPPQLRTVGALIAAYKADKAFTSKRDTTQRGYRQCLDRLQTWAGDAPIRAIDAPRIEKLQASYADRPAFANAVIRVLRLLLDFGRRKGWVAVNSAVRPQLAGAAPMGIIWPRPAVALIVATADAMGRPSIGDAVLLNSWLGQREGDILRMPRTALRGDSLVLRQSKTGAGVSLPIGMVPELMDRLQAALSRAEARNPVPAQIIVSEATGRGYGPDEFRHAFAKVRAKAANTAPEGAPPALDRTFAVDYLLPGRDATDAAAFDVALMSLTFQTLRHTAVTYLAEAECDAALISAITGHSQSTVVAIMSRYMVKTAQMARVAFGKRIAAEAPPPKGADTVKGAG